MLSYTGHPLVDVGVATICAFAGKPEPAALTEADLEAIARYMAANYTVDPLKSFLTVAFPNSGFTQPAFEKNPEKRQEYAREVLLAWQPGRTPLGEPCVFTGAPAILRSYRQHVPLLTGEDVVNFHPHGDPGLPVSGAALLAIQAFPLGCAKVGGRLLAVHADDPDLTYRFARTFLERNRRLVHAAQQAGERKLPEPPRRVGTLLVESLLEVECERQDLVEERGPVSVTAYHLSNSGQGVGLDIYHLPLEITDFLQRAMSARHRVQWDALRGRGWEVMNRKGARRGPKEDEPRYNVLYEDLLRLPNEAAWFIRRYLLRLPYRGRDAGDPRAGYSLLGEPELVSFDFTELFLRTVVNMERERIERIRALGDALAEYVQGENDRHFFRNFMTAQRADHLRATLIRASVARMRKGRPPLVAFDPYIEVFEVGEDLPRFDWKLARDLVLIRMVERLYALGWIQSHAQELPEVLDGEGESA